MISPRQHMAARVRRSVGTATSISSALDTTLDLRKATKPDIEQAMKGHVLANAELIGTYQKGDR
jgi:hypothetical protein